MPRSAGISTIALVALTLSCGPSFHTLATEGPLDELACAARNDGELAQATPKLIEGLKVRIAAWELQADTLRPDQQQAIGDLFERYRFFHVTRGEPLRGLLERPIDPHGWESAEYRRSSDEILSVERSEAGK
jgi:hypothetical protein